MSFFSTPVHLCLCGSFIQYCLIWPLFTEWIAITCRLAGYVTISIQSFPALVPCSLSLRRSQPSSHYSMSTALRGPPATAKFSSPPTYPHHTHIPTASSPDRRHLNQTRPDHSMWSVKTNVSLWLCKLLSVVRVGSNYWRPLAPLTS